jgi:hypothetical protein
MKSHIFEVFSDKVAEKVKKLKEEEDNKDVLTHLKSLNWAKYCMDKDVSFKKLMMKHTKHKST